MIQIIGFVVQITAQSSSTEPLYCSAVQTRCYAQYGCQNAMLNFVAMCSQHTSGGRHSRRRGYNPDPSHGAVHDPNSCPTQCVEALVALLSTSDGIGEGFMTCDCQREPLCENQRNRMIMCQNQIYDLLEQVHDTHSVVSCTLAELFCLADTSCKTAFEFYEEHCELMIIGEMCTRHCNNSVSILYHRSRARKLRSCSCHDYGGFGEEGEQQCLRVKSHMERLCLWSMETLPPTTALTTTIQRPHSLAPTPTPRPTTTTACNDYWSETCGASHIFRTTNFLYLSLSVLLLHMFLIR